MKKLSILFIFLFTATVLLGQSVGINTDGTPAHSSSILDVKSTTKGMLMPRMTSAQRAAIASPALGLLVYDTDTKTIWTYNGLAWTNLSAAASGLTLPYDNSVGVTGSAFKITNTGTAIEGITTGVSSNGIRGIATVNGSNGVYGGSTSANGVGVRGEASGTGTGVLGYSTSGTGISAGSISGTGIYTSSSSGLALNVNGNVKISGGNTNPGEGKVLTSDASGNAIWKTNRIAFRGFNINTNHTSVPDATPKKVYFAFENYDLGSGFIPYELSGTPPANASTFAIPVDGIYHFDVSLTLFLDNDYDPYTEVSLKLDRAGNISTLASSYGIESKNAIVIYDSKFYDLKISGDFLLFPGDKVYVEVYQNNSGSKTASITTGNTSYFNGHLVVAY